MHDHKKIESEIAKFWEIEKIYEKLVEKNKSGTPFYFCDGPPYATGQIHPGTAWNKAIKDSVCRYQRGIGKNVRAQPGYDTHGLPIEVKVEKEMKIKNKNEIEKIGIEKFIKECKKFATKYIGVMNGQFKSIGVWMDYENPYITYKDDYINASWKTLKKAWEKKLMHEGEYVLPYCYRCETTMANYELEYAEETDPSIYVKFKIIGNEKEYLIIWTTTPWTLVANMGVMVHPIFSYVKIKVEDEIWIVAKERMEYLLNAIGKSGVVIEELSGKKLEGIKYAHPFQNLIKKEYERKVILSDEYVNLEDGTGLVHTAPGTGPEDFIIGKRYGIEPFCPVDEHGKYTKEAGEFAGKNVKQANPDIIKVIEENKTLIYQDRIKHRYPHCWRCKTPLIFLTTKQWFINISEIKEQMLGEIENIEWHPDFVKTRFSNFVESAPDWCISRQRYWGIPLPIWKCNKCLKIKVIGDKKELECELAELHRPYIDEVEFECECGEKMHRICDVLDVWFDSGNAVWASMSDEEIKKFGEQSEVIIEGQDQIRGWFYSLLGSGIIKNGKSPYKKLLMHGFFVDEHGEKMSKSLGNFVPLEEILEKHGADCFRLWSLSNAVWDELKFNWTELKEAYSDIMIYYNMYVFLTRFCEKKPAKPKKLTSEDEWLLSRLNNTIKEFHYGFENYEINKSARALRYFLIEDLSRWYMKIAKGRINEKEQGSAAIWMIYYSMFEATKMIGIFCPFISEKIYQDYFKKFEEEESLYFFKLNSEGSEKINVELERKMEFIKEICSVSFTLRQKAQIKTRWPISAVYIESNSQEMGDALGIFEETIKSFLNCKKVIANQKPEGKLFEGEFSLGKISIEGSIDQSLYEEGMANEIKRRIQNMRKEENLVEKQEIELWIDGEEELKKIAQNMEKNIKETVNAREIHIGENKGEKEFEIDGRKISIKIKKSK
ncbi:MAG: isoleucine--tRNA ligase [Candidatus Micrarchaeia archaeon]